MSDCLHSSVSDKLDIDSKVFSIRGRKFLIEVKKDKNFVVRSSCCSEHEPVTIIYSDGYVQQWRPL